MQLSDGLDRLARRARSSTWPESAESDCSLAITPDQPEVVVEFPVVVRSGSLALRVGR